MKVKELFSSEEKWCKKAYARDDQGKAVFSKSQSAVSWCLIGAICKCYESIIGQDDTVSYPRINPGACKNLA